MKILACLSVSLWFMSAVSAVAEIGDWTTEETFAQANVACFRVYKCGPNEDVMYGGDKKIVASTPRTVWGICSAAGGPPDSCNECLTNPPADACEWHLQTK
jgi:hypothetical protein